MRKTGKMSKKLVDVDVKEASDDAEVEKDIESDVEDELEPAEEAQANGTDSVVKSPKKRKASESGDDEPAKTADSEADGKGDDSFEPDESPPKKKKKAGKPAKAKKSPKPAKKAVGRHKKPTVEEEEPEEFEVEKVVGLREVKKKRQFLIRWKGYKADSDTWEAEDGLSCDAAIEAYLSSLPVEKKGKKAKKGKKDDDDDDEGEESTEQYEVEKILEVHHKKNGKDEFLVRWKGYGKKDDTWEPEEHLSCPELITKFKAKVTAAKSTGHRELRIVPTHTKRFTVAVGGGGRRLSRRSGGKQRPPLLPSNDVNSLREWLTSTEAARIPSNVNSLHEWLKSTQAARDRIPATEEPEIEDRDLADCAPSEKPLSSHSSSSSSPSSALSDDKYLLCLQKIQKLQEKVIKQIEAADDRVFAFMEAHIASQETFQNNILEMFRQVLNK